MCILVCADGHYCAPVVANLLRRLRCDNSLGLPVNAARKAISAHWRGPCVMRRKPSRPKGRRFHQFEYAAKSWAQNEKVVAGVKAMPHGDSFH